MDTAGKTQSAHDVAAHDAASLDRIAKRVTEISSLPHVALRVMEIAGDPQSCTTELKAALEADPALCVRVLRCVNSAAFGLRSEISDLSQAIAYLGFNQIRDLAVTASVSDLFCSTSPVGTYQRPALWKHLVAVGVGARMIAMRRKIRGLDNAFLAGLLHDIGIILFDQAHHEAFRKVILMLTPETTLTDVEQRVVGWDHTRLARRVGEQWRLPVVVLDAMRHHHEPQLYSGPHEDVVHSVAVANVLCSIREISSVGRNLVGLSSDSLRVLQLDREDLKILAVDLEGELARHQHLFDIQRS
jgi:HD-like signal output (HDOD) protein